MEKLLVLLLLIGVSKSLDPNIVAQITGEVGKIPSKKLADSFYVRQNVEGNKLHYLSHKQTIFISKNVDQRDKDVIVLHKHEDGLDDCGEKNVYVVLIVNDKTSSKYNVLYAYLRSKGKNSPRFIEWDSYNSRGGGSRNKAFIFGHEHCSRSLLTSCKLTKPDESFPYTRNLNVREDRPNKNDFVCDITNTVEEAQLTGSILTSLNMAVTILAGADLIYKDEMKTHKSVVQQLLSQQKMKLGRSFNPKSGALLQNITETAAGKFLEDGKQALSTGVLMFYLLVGSIGQIAERLILPDSKEVAGSNPQLEEIRAEMRKKLGLKLLGGLFEGNYDIRANSTVPFPGLLLQESIARQIMFAGQDVDDDDDEEDQPKKQKGRGMFGIGTKPKATNARPLQASENLNTAFTKSKEKSAGQIFAQNTKAGFYVPYGIIEKVGDVVGQAAGIGKINEERTVLDQAIEGVLDVGTKAVGSVVDVAANVLKPFGLGPLSKIAAGIGGAALGLAAGIASCEKMCAVMAGHQAIKIGMKVFGLGGILGNSKKKKKPPPAQDDAKYGALYAQLEAEMMATGTDPLMVGVAPPPVLVQGLPPPVVGVAVQPAPPPMAVGVAMGVGAPQGGVAMGVGAPQGGVAMGVGAPPGGVPVGQFAPGLPVEMETELDLFTTWGWISQSMSVENLWVDIMEPNTFIGFGISYLEIKEDNSYQKIAKYETYIDFLMRVLRIDNRKELRTQIVDLVKKKYVKYDDKAKIFVLLDKSLILVDSSLTSGEEIYLYLSFELVAFSKAYKSLTDSSLLLQCPTGEKISKSVALVQQMTQEYISLTLMYGDVHMVKLLRNYGYTLKTMYTKSLQDVYRYNTCQKCSPKSISLVDNNAISIYGMMQFVLYGSWDYYTTIWTAGPPSPDKFEITIITATYNSYFLLNRNEFITDVSKYII